MRGRVLGIYEGDRTAHPCQQNVSSIQEKRFRQTRQGTVSLIHANDSLSERRLM
jgi:hypothetical protein